MRHVKATNLSPFEAEDLVAKIWIALEKHGLSSPEITIFSRATKLEIEFLFESPRDARLVRAELPRAIRRNMSALATAGNCQALSAMVVAEPQLYTTAFGTGAMPRGSSKPLRPSNWRFH
jgi:hypothetical protein